MGKRRRTAWDTARGIARGIAPQAAMTTCWTHTGKALVEASNKMGLLSTSKRNSVAVRSGVVGIVGITTVYPARLHKSIPNLHLPSHLTEMELAPHRFLKVHMPPAPHASPLAQALVAHIIPYVWPLLSSAEASSLNTDIKAADLKLE